MPTTVRRALEVRAAALAAFATATLLSFLAVIDLLARGELAIDFRSFFFAWKAVQGGGDVYDVGLLDTLAAQQWGHSTHVWPYIYPPFLAYALSPVASLGYTMSMVAWALAGVAAMGLALTAISGILLRAPVTAGGPALPRQVPLQEAVLLSALLVCLLPLRNNVAHGQVNLLVLAFVALSVRAFLRGDDVWSGAFLAPAVLIKLTPAVLLVAFVARRRPKAAVTCLSVAALLALATLPLGAWPAWKSYFHHLPRLAHGSVIDGLFEPGMIWNMAPAGMFARWFPGHRTVVKVLSAGLSILLLSVAALFARRSRRREDELLALAPFFPAMLLVSPLVYVHHVVYLAPAAAVWIERAWRERRPWTLISITALLLAAAAELPALYERLMPTGWVFRFGTSLNTYAMLGLFVLGLSMLRAPRPAGG